MNARRIVASMLLGTALAAPPAAQAQWQLPPLLFAEPITFEAGYTHDDNVNRGREGERRRPDDLFGLGLSHSRNRLLVPKVRAEVTALLNGEGFRNYTRLSRLSAGIQGTVQYRVSGAFDATTFGIIGRTQYDHYTSYIRRGPRYYGALTAERALTDRIDVQAEVGGGARFGRSDVFRGSEYVAKVNLGYSLRTAGTLYLGGEYRRGATVSGGGPSLVNLDLASVLVPDDAFGEDQQFSYRFDARTVIATVGWNYPLGPRDALDLSWRHIEVKPRDRPAFDAGGTVRYIDNQYSITYLRRF